MSGEGRGRLLIVEADGGSRGNPGPAGYGALVRDAATGELLVEVAEHIGTATNNVAEYRGLLAGLRAAREVDPAARVEVRMDSKLVVEQMAGRWRIKHRDLQPIALEARAVFPPQAVDYVWVPRERNAHADRLANEALDAASRGEPWTQRASAPVAVDEAEVERLVAAPTNRLVGWADDMGLPTTFLLLRHGETAHTAEKRFSGSADGPELSSRGRWQAERAAETLAGRGAGLGVGLGIGFDAVLSSPLRRAQQTAEVVATRLGLPVRTDDDLRECDFGAWDGLAFAEVRARWPAELDAWLASTTVPPPGGESFAAVFARVRRARDRIIARYPGQHVLVVAHVTPIKSLVRLALEAPPHALYRMELQPASLTAIQWYGDGNASLRLFNDAAHLAGDWTAGG